MWATRLLTTAISLVRHKGHVRAAPGAAVVDIDFTRAVDDDVFETGVMQQPVERPGAEHVLEQRLGHLIG